METYARELIAALYERGDVEMVAFVNRVAAATPGPWNELARQAPVPVDARRRTEWVRGEQQHVPRLARAEGVDLVHSLASTAPLHGPRPRVTTIHDLLFLKAPEAHFGLMGLGMRVLVPLAAHRSDRVIAVSGSTAGDVARHLRVPRSRIDIVPEAADTAHRAVPDPESELRVALGLGDRPVLLSVSAKRPHKNLLRLLGALGRIPAERRPLLVLPGYPTPHEQELRTRADALRLTDDVRMPGWIGAGQLEGLYALARAFVFPSLYEGFGLPVLEALRRGLPVACSDRSSLPEVAGDAALLFEPTDEGAIAAALERVLVDERLRERLRAAGRVQAARFTWAATAAGTVESYRRALAR